METAPPVLNVSELASVSPGSVDRFLARISGAATESSCESPAVTFSVASDAPLSNVSDPPPASSV